ncbi:SpaA isopeptide-forming pilin-related protein [Olsenella sp. AM04-33]|uniref:SpaA isopeptide-forming pilin-related protein n=1 Tax=Olsenella sp. AM04-33 TaxID=2292049 RepID=UPI0011C46AAA|nr:SpaA isopeptide-forming pilin-related protein [Olsenella sp. AM04-33]
MGPGHAGRRSLWQGVLAIALAAVLTVEQLLGGGTALNGIALAQSPAAGNKNIGYLHNPDGSRYISDLLGVTRQQVVDELTAHEHDSYYLGTPYKGVQETGSMPRPNGDPGAYSPGMQCNGFVAYVLNKVGGTPYQTFVNANGHRGNWTSLLNWFAVCSNNDVVSYTFDSKEELLASGLLQKGDIICAVPYSSVLQAGKDAYGNTADDHVGFFWGSSAGEDLFWHSAHRSNGISSGESLINGNQISAISPKCYPSCWVLFPMGPANGRVELVKQSANRSITDGNGSYSLQGARYGLYSDAQCTQLVQSATTDENGHAAFASVPTGNYYVHEIHPSKGYLLDEQIYPVSVSAGSTAQVHGAPVEEVPASAPGGAIVQKLDAKTGGAAQGNGSLAGAQFTVSYYGNTTGDVSGNPLRTWVFATDESGVATYSSSQLVSGDQLFANSQGEAVFPLGTYGITETKAPEDYALTDSSTHVAVVTLENGTAIWKSLDGWNNTTAVKDVQGRGVSDEVLLGSIHVGKIDHQLKKEVAQGDATLAGARFQVRNVSDHPVYVGNATYAVGEIISGLEFVTDANGTATSEKILPYGTYELREVQPPEGYELNSSWVGVATVTGSKDPADAGTVDETVERPHTPPMVKVDINLGSDGPQGDATFEGTEVSITNASEGDVVYNDMAIAPGEVVCTLAANAEGKFPIIQLPYGTYVLRETKAPKGYLLNEQWTKTIVLHEESEETVELPDTPIAGGLCLDKIDRELAAADPQGNASLEGAHFQITNESKRPVVISGVAYAPGEAITGIDLVTDAHGHATTTANQLPYGRYTVREVAAPEGYLLNETWKADVSITENGTVVSAQSPVDDQVIRGGVRVGKVDRETLGNVPLGSATLAGATFTVTNDSSHPVLVGDATVDPDEVALTLTTDENGTAYTSADALPYGTYTIRETAAPAGYLLDSEARLWSATFQVEEDGKTIDLTKPEDAAHDQVMRTDIRLVKRDENSQKPMANVAFLITSLTTGERHVAVTDENGIFDSSVYALEQRTNANDAVLSERGADSSVPLVDSTKLDSSNGVWFGGVANANGKAIESLAAFPYDRYEVQELRCDANRGRELVSFQLTTELPQSRHNAVLDLGTIDNREESVPSIQTTATDEKTGRHEGEVQESTGIVDVVAFEGLAPGTSYELHGTLMDAESGEPILDAEGNSVEVTQQFVPAEADDTVAMPFEVAGAAVDGKGVVVFETLYRDGQEVVSHKDLNAASQTVDYREEVPSSGSESKQSNGKTQREVGGIPQTGDTTARVAIGACAALGCAGIILALWRRRKG